MRTRSILAGLLLAVAGLQTAWAQEAYAVLGDGGEKVTFYYDTQKNNRSGVVEINKRYISSGSNAYGSARTAVFDESFAFYRPTSTVYWFQNCSNLTSIEGLENLHTEEVTDMNSMFYSCRSLTSINLSSFNTAKVTSMESMFWKCDKLTTLDVSNFNTANVTDMNYMFGSCKSLTTLNLSSFNTANVTNMKCMFNVCSMLRTIYVDEDTWSVEKVSASNGEFMFDYCTRIVGGNGTTYSQRYNGVEYACVDKPGQPGYLTALPTYSLWIAGKQVNGVNCGDVLGDGTVAYNPETKTLTLSDATIQGFGPATGNASERGTGIYIEESDVTIDVQGICTVTGDTECEALWFGFECRRPIIAGDGTLKLVSDYIALFDNVSGDTLTIGGNVMVEADGGIMGLYRNRFGNKIWYNTLRITDFATVKAKRSDSLGITRWKELLLENEHEVTAPEGVYWDAEQHEPLHADGNRITGGEWVVIDRKLVTYPIWIVGTQVTETNLADVLGDGSVSYDPETCTLTLNNANITGDNEKTLIKTTSPLNILLIGENTVSDAWCETCIYAELSDSDGEVHITGPGSLHVVGGGIGIGVSSVLSIDGGA